MTTFGWVQLALFMGPVAADPADGRLSLQVLDATGKTFLDPILRPVERAPVFSPEGGPPKGAGLEAVHRFHARVQLGGGSFHLCDSAAAAPAAVEPSGAGAVHRPPGVQHGGELHDQHQLAKLRRGIHRLLSVPDGGADVSQLHFRRRGDRHSSRPGARHCQAIRQDHRQFLGGPRAGESYTFSCPCASSTPCSWCPRA